MRDITQAQRQSARKGAVSLAPLADGTPTGDDLPPTTRRAPRLPNWDREAAPGRGAGSASIPGARASSLPPKLEPLWPGVPDRGSWSSSSSSRQPVGPAKSASQKKPLAPPAAAWDHNRESADVTDMLIVEVVKETIVNEVLAILAAPDLSLEPPIAELQAGAAAGRLEQPGVRRSMDAVEQKPLASPSGLPPRLPQQVRRNLSEQQQNQQQSRQHQMQQEQMQALIQQQQEQLQKLMEQQQQQQREHEEKQEKLLLIEERMRSNKVLQAAQDAATQPAQAVCDVLLDEVVQLMVSAEASKAVKDVADEYRLASHGRLMIQEVIMELSHALAHETLADERLEHSAGLILIEATSELLRTVATEAFSTSQHDQEVLLGDIDANMHLDPAIDAEFVDRCLCEHFMRVLATRAEGLHLRQYENLFVDGIMGEILLHRSLLFGRQQEALARHHKAWSVLESLTAEAVLDHTLLELRAALDREAAAEAVDSVA